MRRLFVRAAVVTACIPLTALASRGQSVTLTRQVQPLSITRSGAGGQAFLDFTVSPGETPALDASDPGTFVNLLSYVLNTSGPVNTTFDDPFSLTVGLKNAGPIAPGTTGSLVLSGRVTGNITSFSSTVEVSLDTGAGVSVLAGGGLYSFDAFSYTQAVPNSPFSQGAVSARLRYAGSPARGTAPEAVESSPTAIDGNVYFAADDGKVYATNASTGEALPGFPTTGTIPGRILGRAAVYGNGGAKAVYVTSDSGFVTKVNADGSIAWSKQPLGASSAAANASTPAVLPSGDVIVGLSSDAGSYVVDLDGATGDTVRMSPPLGGAGSSISAPAVDGNNVYVGLTGGADGDIVLLSLVDLTPRAGGGIATGEGVTAPPYIKSAAMYVGTLAGNFYKVNSATFSPDPVFGATNGGPGKAAVGEPLPTSAFPDDGSALPTGTFYVGTTKGKIFAVDAVTGAVSPFFDTGDDAAAVGGVVIHRTDAVLAFGTSAGTFHQVPLQNPGGSTQVQGLGAIRTTPTVDLASKSFLIGSDDGHVYSFPVL